MKSPGIYFVEQKEKLERFRVSHPFRKIKVDKREWEYLCSPARKEAILFLIGGLRYAEFAYQHIMALEKNYCVITPSYGPSPTIEDTIHAIITILDHEGIEKAHVVGQSLGGLVAQCIVRKYPHRFETMIISNTTAPAEDIDPVLRKQIVKKLKKKIRILRYLPYWIIRRVTTWRFAKLFSRDTDKAEFQINYIREVLQYNTTKQELINTFQLMVDLGENYTFSKVDLQEWTGRILLIGSDHDPAFSPSEWDSLKRLYPQAEEYIFHGTGHLAIMSKRQEYLQVVTDFIQS